MLNALRELYRDLENCLDRQLLARLEAWQNRLYWLLIFLSIPVALEVAENLSGFPTMILWIGSFTIIVTALLGFRVSNLLRVALLGIIDGHSRESVEKYLKEYQNIIFELIFAEFFTSVFLYSIPLPSINAVPLLILAVAGIFLACHFLKTKARLYRVAGIIFVFVAAAVFLYRDPVVHQKVSDALPGQQTEAPAPTVQEPAAAQPANFAPPPAPSLPFIIELDFCPNRYDDGSGWQKKCDIPEAGDYYISASGTVLLLVSGRSDDPKEPLRISPAGIKARQSYQKELPFPQDDKNFCALIGKTELTGKFYIGEGVKIHIPGPTTLWLNFNHLQDKASYGNPEDVFIHNQGNWDVEVKKAS